MIKKYWVYALFCIAVIFFVVREFGSKKHLPNGIEVKPISVGNGWGYQIFVDNKIYITQNNIPGVAGFKPFINKDEALKVANFVALKVATSKELPTVSNKQLDSLGITK